MQCIKINISKRFRDFGQAPIIHSFIDSRFYADENALDAKATGMSAFDVSLGNVGAHLSFADPFN